MPADDELEQQLRAFGETLQDRAGEPIRPTTFSDSPIARPGNQQLRWAFAAAAAVTALVVGAVLVVGSADDAVVTTATLPDVEVDTSPTIGEPSEQSTTTPASDPGFQPWEPMVFSGAGSQTITIPDDPMIMRLTGAVELFHDGTGPFAVTLIEDEFEGTIETTVLDTIGPYSGRRGWRLIEAADTPTRVRSIEVEADGNWSLELFSIVQSTEYTRLEFAPGAAVSGSGDDVIQLLGLTGSSPSTLIADFECSGCSGDIEVVSVRNGVQVVVNGEGDGGAFTDSGLLPSASLAILVQTSSPGVAGDWTITLRDPDTATAPGADSGP